MTPTLAIDFGTSNSAAAILDGGRVRRIPIEAGGDTLPTAVFFPAERGAMRIGEAAAQALIGGEEGRYMRALKSVLGTALMHEKRLIEGKRRSLSDVVTAFLATLRERAEAATGQTFRRALSGRPVHFHTADHARDAKALTDLRACYLAAGFDHVDFLPEPEAAARAALAASDGGRIGLVVDIGGGTSDFSLFRADGGRVRILASHGIRLGGTDFDRAVSLTHAMPLLGMGSTVRRDFGPGELPVPNAVFVELATWAKIPFLYTPEVRREVADLHRLAVEPEKLARLARVLEHETGHELAFAVERGKIAANGAEPGAAIAMPMAERGLSAPIGPESLNAALQGYSADLHAAAEETLRLAGLAPAEVGVVVYVGGSSLMQLVTEGMAALFPDARAHHAEAFTAVVDGLAIASGETADA